MATSTKLRTSLTEHLEDRSNNFDVLRIGAAMAVLVSHSFALTGHREPTLPGTTHTLGAAGVFVFFAISGFLVTRSWVLQPHVAAFAAKRFLRIWPGLIVALLLTSFVVAPLLVAGSGVDFLTSSKPFAYFTYNTLLHTQLHIPGLFEDNFYARTVNGSLGTLPVEVEAYAILAIFGTAIVALRRRSAGRVLAMAALAIFVAYVVLTTGTRTPVQILPMYTSFAAGAVIYLGRHFVRLDLPWLAGAIVLYVAAFRLPSPIEDLAVGVAIAYVVTFFAFRGLAAFRFVTRPGDVSYGVYIYAFMVQQSLAQLTNTRSVLLMTGMAVAVTYPLAVLSWHAIEKPALKAKRRLVGASVRQWPEQTARTASPSGALGASG